MTHGMHGMKGRWQRYSLMLVVVILTITSFGALVHRHVAFDDLGCVLCHVRHEPGIENPVSIALAQPLASERERAVAGIQLRSHDSVPVRSGRAPPTSF